MAEHTGDFKVLMEKVFDWSEEKHMWSKACAEWDVVDRWDLEDGETTTCQCGQEDIVHCAAIKNRQTGKVLKPIGSVCITKFDDNRLTQQMRRFETVMRFNGIVSELYEKNQLNVKNIVRHFKISAVIDDMRDHGNISEFDWAFLTAHKNKSDKKMDKLDLKRRTRLIEKYIASYTRKRYNEEIFSSLPICK